MPSPSCTIGWSQARQIAATVTATSTGSALADTQRRQLVTDCARRTETLVALQAQRAEAELQETGARQVAESRFDGGRTGRRRTGRRPAPLRSRARGGGGVSPARRPTGWRPALRASTRIENQLAQLATQLDAITLTDTMLTGIEEHFAAVQRIDAQLQADATTVAFTAPTDLDITVDGRARTLSAGQSWTQPASAAVVVEVPGVLSVRIDPGASAVKLIADRDAAQQRLDRELEAAGSSTPRRHGRWMRGAARSPRAAPRTPPNSRVCAQARMRVVARPPGSCARSHRTAGGGSRGGRCRLTAARDALRDARTHAEKLQKVAADAASAQVEKSTAATVLRTRCAVAETEAVAAHEQLATVRAAVTDEALAARAAADAEEQRKADEAVAALAERYAAADPEAVATELAAAAGAVDAIAAERETAKLELHTIAAELGVMGSEGRQGQLDDAQAELKRACAEQSRVQERAQAAALLRSTMIRHRDNTRERYVQPYRTELEQLTGPAGVRPHLRGGRRYRADDPRAHPGRLHRALRVALRRRQGATRHPGPAGRCRPGGREDTVPVVIDDALGFTDPERLTKMGAVFDSVGNHGQVIVLTCMPTRYVGVQNAHVIELSA